jgi:CRP/FNR family transcriptional regulator, dissimilatory nitrate respiration regulator
VSAPPIRIQAFLANVPLFGELAPAEIDRIAAHTRQVHAARGEMLFRQGDEASGFHVIVFGQVKLAFISARGDEKIVDVLGPGQSFGEAVMFMERPHVVTAQALTDSLLLHVAGEAVFDELERDPRFARRMIAGLSRRLHDLMGNLEGHLMRSGRQRVIGFLLHESGCTAPGKGALGLTLPMSKSVIASRLNLTLEHFSRILHELAAEGLIEVRGRGVQIPDLERLQAFDS